jgi:hypothetical protein
MTVGSPQIVWLFIAAKPAKRRALGVGGCGFQHESGFHLFVFEGLLDDERGNAGWGKFKVAGRRLVAETGKPSLGRFKTPRRGQTQVGSEFFSSLHIPPPGVAQTGSRLSGWWQIKAAQVKDQIHAMRL